VADLLPYADALAAVLAECRPVETERVPLAAAAGRVLAVAPPVDLPLPPFANSAMDGFAVRAADIGPAGAALPLDPPVPAGTAPPPLRGGHAAPIGTGGVVPGGADAIVPIEDAVREGDRVRLPGGVRPGAFVRSAGSDLPAGPSPLLVGAPLRPADGALLASIGAVQVEVFRRPRVAIVATGAELIPPDRVPGPAQIRDSNSTALSWAHTRAGAYVQTLGIATDEPEATRILFAQALDADMVITSAGVSVGERDLVRATLAELGVEPRFWRIDLKPGKPVAFGMRGDVPVISLPGNPASNLVCSTLIAEPAVRARGGWAEPHPSWQPAASAGDWPRPEPRAHAVRCRLVAQDGRLTAIPSGDQGSHRIGSMVEADALALLEPGRAVHAGEPVSVTRL
jgi:molybdopterin molybdotransferase